SEHWTADGSKSHEGSGGSPPPADEASLIEPLVGAVSTHGPVASGTLPQVSPGADSNGTTNWSTRVPVPSARRIVSLPQLIPNGKPPTTFSTTSFAPAAIVVPAGKK